MVAHRVDALLVLGAVCLRRRRSQGERHEWCGRGERAERRAGEGGTQTEHSCTQARVRMSQNRTEQSWPVRRIARGRDDEAEGGGEGRVCVGEREGNRKNELTVSCTVWGAFIHNTYQSTPLSPLRRTPTDTLCFASFSLFRPPFPLYNGPPVTRWRPEGAMSMQATASVCATIWCMQRPACEHAEKGARPPTTKTAR